MGHSLDACRAHLQHAGSGSLLPTRRRQASRPPDLCVTNRDSCSDTQKRDVETHRRAALRDACRAASRDRQCIARRRKDTVTSAHDSLAALRRSRNETWNCLFPNPAVLSVSSDLRLSAITRCHTSERSAACENRRGARRAWISRLERSKTRSTRRLRGQMRCQSVV